MHKNIFKKIFNVLMKIGYFNTGFVSLQYKNTNQYCAKLIDKYTEKSQKKFEEFFIFFSWVQLGPYG